MSEVITNRLQQHNQRDIMLTTQLKQATAALHKQAEQLSFTTEIFAGRLEPAQFLSLLERNYWLNSEVEQACCRVGLSERFPELELDKRQKSHLLVNDLKAAGAWPPVTPQAHLPEMGFDQLLGALYVVEGSTLGGKVIAQALGKHSRLTKMANSQFLSAYGDQLGAYWQRFTSHLNQLARNDCIDRAKVIEGASATFGYFIELSNSSAKISQRLIPTSASG